VPEAPPPEQLAVVRSAELEVVALPFKGADIYAIVDRATGIDVLFKSPWGWRGPERLGAPADTMQHWIARYAGGWQQLVPHGGAPCEVAGVLRGYHGEAAIVAWQVVEHTADRIRMVTELMTAPLRLERTLTVSGAVLSVHDLISNLSDVPVPVTWVEHPGFGAPFIDGRCRIYAGARTVVNDADAPGTVLAPDALTAFPAGLAADGSELDLSWAPPPESRRAVFAALTDFDEGWYAITSPTAGFGIGVAWDPSVLPHAWFWQECHATAQYPWFSRAYVVAVEPANVLPGTGDVAGRRRGAPPVLAGGAEWVAELTFVRFASTSPVRRVLPDGTVDVEPANGPAGAEPGAHR